MTTEKKKKKISGTESFKKELVNDILSNTTELKKNHRSMNNNSGNTSQSKKIFAPEIRDSNNILIRMIKKELKEQQISQKDLSLRFDSMSEWNNFKRALIIRDSITIEGFGRWMEVLNKDWKIVIKDHEKKAKKV